MCVINANGIIQMVNKVCGRKGPGQVLEPAFPCAALEDRGIEDQARKLSPHKHKFIHTCAGAGGDLGLQAR